MMASVLAICVLVLQLQPAFAVVESEPIDQSDNCYDFELKNENDLSRFSSDKNMFVSKGVDAKVTVMDSNDIVIESNCSVETTMKLPKVLNGAKAVLTDDGAVMYNAPKENIKCVVQMDKTKANGEMIEFVKNDLIIENINAEKQYAYEFKLEEGGKLQTQAEYEKNLQLKNINLIDNKKGVCNEELLYVVNAEGVVVNTIEIPNATDANGNVVAASYQIKGNQLIQTINFNSDTEFPVVSTMSSYAPKTKYNTVTMERSSANAEKAKEARRRINARQNSTLSTFCSVMTSILGYLPGVDKTVSYTTTLISSVYGGISKNLERQEDMYTTIYEVFTSTASLEKSVKKVNIVYPLYGTYQGKNKGYTYQQRDEYAEYYNSSGTKIDASNFA